MSHLLDLSSWKLSNIDLIEQVATLLSTVRGDEYKFFYSSILGSKIAYDLYNRLTVNNDIEILQTQCIMAIVDYIKSHPKASEDELTEIVAQHIKIFKEKVRSV